MNITPFATCNADQKYIDATGKLVDLQKSYHIMPFYGNFQAPEQNMHEKWIMASVQTPANQAASNLLMNALEHPNMKIVDIKKELDASESARNDTTSAATVQQNQTGPQPQQPQQPQQSQPVQQTTTPAPPKKSTRRRHIKNFACDKCPKRFDSRSKLKDHQYVHTGEKPYQCQLCDSAFRNVNNLGRHSMVHFSEKNFKCSLCSSSFKCAAYLRKHMFTHTMTKKCVTCKLCSKQFTRPEFLRRHHRRVHSNLPKSEQFDCNACDKKFFDAGTLKEHQATHGNVYSGQSRSNDVNAFDKR